MNVMIDVIRLVACPRGIPPERVAAPVRAVDEVAGEDRRAEWVRPELERGDDAEVAAAAATSPDGVLARACRQPLARRARPRAGCRSSARRGASATPPRRQGSGPQRRCRTRRRLAPRGRVPAWRRRGPRALRRADPSRAAGGGHVDRPELAEVEDDASNHGSVAGDVVTAAAHCQRQVHLASEPDRGCDVARTGGADDRQGTSVDHAVPDPRGVVLRVALGNDRPARRRPTSA